MRSFHCSSLAIIAVMLSMVTRGIAQDCRVTTTVRLLNQEQQPILNITADELKAEIAGMPAKVIAFSRANVPGMILLIDASSSMKDKWNESVAAAKQLAARPEGVAAVVFRESIEAYANGRSDTQKLLDQLSIRTFRTGIGTSLYDILIEIAGRLKNRNTAIVVISDGHDNASLHSPDETLRLFLRSSWPPVFGLVLDYGHNNSGGGYFKEIAVKTGGLLVVPQSASKVPEAVNTLADELSAPFTVTLEPTKPISKPEKLKIEVFGPDSKPRHDIHVAHLAEVAGCDPTPF